MEYVRSVCGLSTGTSRVAVYEKSKSTVKPAYRTPSTQRLERQRPQRASVCVSAAARALVLFLGISASGALQHHPTMTSFHGARALSSYVVVGQSKTV